MLILHQVDEFLLGMYVELGVDALDINVENINGEIDKMESARL